MAKAELPSPELLRQLLDYDPETGALYWKERQPHHFKSGRGLKSWNQRFVGMRADKRVQQKRGARWMEVNIYEKSYRAHRVMWAIHHGEWPQHQIDHINGDDWDNRLANLRDVSDLENKRNLPKTSRNKSGTIGVFQSNETHRSKRWLVRIRDNGKNVHIGAFHTKEEAIAARRAAEALYGYHPNHGRELQTAVQVQG